MTAAPVKPRILIADDQPANRFAFQALLEDQYSVTTAEGGPQALELALREEFSVILLDVRMPGMDGFEVSKLLRRHDRTRHVPIVFLSAYDKTPVQLKKGYAAGATDFIFSPVDEEVLRFKVATYVQIHLRNEALRAKIDRMEKLLRELKAGGGKDGAEGRRAERDARLLEATIDDLKKEIERVPPARR